MSKRIPGALSTEDLERYSFSPMGVVDRFYNSIKELKGEEFIPSEPSNPVTHLYEMSAQLHVDTNRRLLTMDKRHYAELGETEEELYVGMTSLDYLDRFALPATADEVVMRIPVEEILVNALPTTNPSVKLLTVGRDTVFAVAGYDLSIYYPIDIKVSGGNNIQVTWNTDVLSELSTIGSNVLKTVRFTPPGSNIEVIDIYIPTSQHTRVSTINEITSKNFNNAYEFTGQYYHAEVFMLVNNQWEQIDTTHSAITYNPNKVTAVLKKVGQELLLHIPQIYFERNIVGGKLRVDILSTRGEVSMNLTGFSPSMWSYRFRDFTAPNDRYQLKMGELNNILLFSPGFLTGGANERTPAELKERKLNNSRIRKFPITEKELQPHIETAGYQVELYSDGLSDRVYKCSKDLPKPNEFLEYDFSGLASRAQVSLGSAQLNLSLDSLYNLPYSKYNSEKLITISNKQAYLFGGEGVSGLTPIDIDTIASGWGGDVEIKLNWLNEHRLVYSPFYYTIDAGEDVLSVGAFYMDSPKVSEHSFIDDNSDVALAISTTEIKAVKTEKGYKLIFAATTSGLENLAPNKVGLQVSLRPWKENLPIYAKAQFITKVDDQLLFELDISIDHLITLNETVKTSTFQRKANEEETYPIGLVNQIEVLWLVEDNQPSSLLDKLKAGWLFDNKWVGLTNERFSLELGQRLWMLGGEHRRTKGVDEYEFYEEDVYMRYEEDIPLRDDEGMPVFELVNGVMKPVWENRIGDLVMIGDEPILLYPAGTPKKQYGELVVVKEGEQSIIFDMVVGEGNYRWITNSNTLLFWQASLSKLLNYITSDMSKIKEKMLPNTRAFFYPKQRLGNIKASETSGEVFAISPEQRPKLRLFCTTTIFEDLELRNSLKNDIHAILISWLDSSRITVSGLVTQLTQLSENIKAVGVSRIADSYEAVTILDPTQHLTLLKEVYVDERGELDIRDVFDIEWIKHP